MKNKFMIRRLFVVAFALALYATKVGMSQMTLEKPVSPVAEAPMVEPIPSSEEVALTLEPDSVAVVPDPTAPQIPQFQDVEEHEKPSSNAYLQEATVLPGDLSPAQETLAIYGGRKVIRAQTKPTAKAAAAVDQVGEDMDPMAALERFYGSGDGKSESRFVDVMGVRVDLTEIDLLVETEIAAGSLKSREDVLNFRRQAINRKAQQLREADKS